MSKNLPYNGIRFTGFLLLLICMPDPAEAWAPGVHYYLATQFLQTGVIAASLSALLNKNTAAFFYGNVVADLVVGKNMLDIEDHSHHWDVGRALRQKARTDEEEALAVGFWTHLAADTVAHNIFLGEQQKKGFSSKRFGHAYWEMQAEDWVPDRYHHDVGEMLDRDHGELRDFLEDTIPETILPFRMNWLMMDGLIRLTGHKTPQSIASFVNRYSSVSLGDSDMERYVTLCLTRMEESLEGFNNRVTRLSPIGKGGRFLP